MKKLLYSVLVLVLIASSVFGYSYIKYQQREDKIANVLEFKSKAFNAYGALANKQYKKAKALYEEALELHSEDSKTLRDYAMCLSKLGENKKAAQMYEKAYHLDRYKVESTLLNLASIYFKIKDYEKSAQYYQELIERFRPKYKYIEKLIVSLLQLNQQDKAMGYYAYVVKKDPNYFKDKFQELKAKYTKDTKALDLLPKYENIKDIDKLLDIARDYKAKGYDKHALKAYYKILYQTKTHDIVNKETADLLLKNYDIDNALLYLKLIEKKDFDVLFKMGGIYHQNKKYKKAIELYELALKKKETPMLLKNLAACSFYNKDKKRVNTYLEKLKKVDKRLAYNFEYAMLIKSGVVMTQKDKIIYQLYNLWFDLKDSLKG